MWNECKNSSKMHYGIIDIYLLLLLLLLFVMQVSNLSLSYDWANNSFIPSNCEGVVLLELIQVCKLNGTSY